MEGKPDNATLGVIVIRHFFKVMRPGFHEKLMLPPAFCKKLKLEKPDDEEAVVTTPKGMWKIKVCKNGEGLMYFNDGWPNFVHHHSLSIGDIVVFEHTGYKYLHFNASVFDSTACEKDFLVELERQKCHNAYRKTANNQAIMKSSVVSHFVKTMTPHNASRKRPRVNIPVEILRSNDLSESTSLTLRDPRGKIWPVKLTIQRNGQYRGYIGGGWHEFYVSNKLKEGDICHFKLHRHPHRANNVVMDVQIFPALV